MLLALSRFASRLFIVSVVGLGLSFSWSLLAQQASPAPQPQPPAATSPSGPASPGQEQTAPEAQKPRPPDPHAVQEKAAEHEALGFLKCLDDGRYVDGYAYTAALIRSKMDSEKFAAEVRKTRAPAGAIQSRTLMDASYTVILPGVPKDQYVVL